MVDEVVKYLVEDIDDFFDPRSYDPDEFYQEAVEHLSIYGYDLNHEVILEAHEGEPHDFEEPHLEVIGRFRDDDEFISMKFVLEDATGEYSVPHVEAVESINELTDLSRKN